MADSRSADAGSKAPKKLSLPPGAPEQTLGKAIVITGTPGVGKSSLARTMARKLDFHLIEVSRLVEEEGLHSGVDELRHAYLVDERRLGSRLREALSATTRKGVILATHFVGNFIPSKLVELALVLRLDPIVLYRRLQSKGWSREKAWENAEAEILDVCLIETCSFLGSEKVCEIDTTSKSPTSILSEALRILARKEKRQIGKINWLSRYDPQLLSRRLIWRRDGSES